MKFSRNQFIYARRKCLRAVEASKRDKFIAACLKGNKNLFDELNKIKKSNLSGPSKIDGLTNPDEIADHFGEAYKKIYNREGSEAPLKSLFDVVNNQCNGSNIESIDVVDTALIKKIVLGKLKNSNVDPEFDMTTDGLKNSPDSLFSSLASLFRAMLVHGYVCRELLVCAILPLIKDKNGKDDDSNNYRGIALSSLFLKIFDWILLSLFKSELKTDQNQFGFEAESSTTMCSWTVIEVVNYFARKGSPVFAALLDYRKAFDYVKKCQNVWEPPSQRNQWDLLKTSYVYLSLPKMLCKMAVCKILFIWSK